MASASRAKNPNVATKISSSQIAPAGKKIAAGQNQAGNAPTPSSSSSSNKSSSSSSGGGGGSSSSSSSSAPQQVPSSSGQGVVSPYDVVGKGGVTSVSVAREAVAQTGGQDLNQTVALASQLQAQKNATQLGSSTLTSSQTTPLQAAGPVQVPGQTLQATVTPNPNVRPNVDYASQFGPGSLQNTSSTLLSNTAAKFTPAPGTSSVASSVPSRDGPTVAAAAALPSSSSAKVSSGSSRSSGGSSSPTIPSAAQQFTPTYQIQSTQQLTSTLASNLNKPNFSEVKTDPFRGASIAFRNQVGGAGKALLDTTEKAFALPFASYDNPRKKELATAQRSRDVALLGQIDTINTDFRENSESIITEANKKSKYSSAKQIQVYQKDSAALTKEYQQKIEKNHEQYDQLSKEFTTRSNQLRFETATTISLSSSKQNLDVNRKLTREANLANYQLERVNEQQNQKLSLKENPYVGATKAAYNVGSYFVPVVGQVRLGAELTGSAAVLSTTNKAPNLVGGFKEEIKNKPVQTGVELGSVALLGGAYLASKTPVGSKIINTAGSKIIEKRIELFPPKIDVEIKSVKATVKGKPETYSVDIESASLVKIKDKNYAVASKTDKPIIFEDIQAPRLSGKNDFRSVNEARSTTYLNPKTLAQNTVGFGGEIRSVAVKAESKSVSQVEGFSPLPNNKDLGVGGLFEKESTRVSVTNQEPFFSTTQVSGVSRTFKQGEDSLINTQIIGRQSSVLPSGNIAQRGFVTSSFGKKSGVGEEGLDLFSQVGVTKLGKVKVVKADQFNVANTARPSTLEEANLLRETVQSYRGQKQTLNTGGIGKEELRVTSDQRFAQVFNYRSVSKKTVASVKEADPVKESSFNVKKNVYSPKKDEAALKQVAFSGEYKKDFVDQQKDLMDSMSFFKENPINSFVKNQLSGPKEDVSFDISSKIPATPTPSIITPAKKPTSTVTVTVERELSSQGSRQVLVQQQKSKVFRFPEQSRDSIYQRVLNNLRNKGLTVSRPGPVGSVKKSSGIPEIDLAVTEASGRTALGAYAKESSETLAGLLSKSGRRVFVGEATRVGVASLSVASQTNPSQLNIFRNNPSLRLDVKQNSLVGFGEFSKVDNSVRQKVATDVRTVQQPAVKQTQKVVEPRSPGNIPNVPNFFVPPPLVPVVAFGLPTFGRGGGRGDSSRFGKAPTQYLPSLIGLESKKTITRAQSLNLNTGVGIRYAVSDAGNKRKRMII